MNDKSYKLSIVIPFYGAENYIGNCLDSILQSDLPKGVYEIVAVNDGSKDTGPSIVETYMRQYDNIRMLTQRNQGQSVARNYGIKSCHGEYVWCVDADDMVDSHLCDIIQYMDGKTDIVSTYLKLVKEDGTFVSISKDHLVPYSKKVTGRSAVVGGFTPTSMCGHFVRRQFMLDNHFFFEPNRTSEDVVLSYRIFSSASVVIFLDKASYIYILHPETTIHTKTKEKTLKFTLDDIFVYKSFKALENKFKDEDPQLSTVISKRAESVLFGLLASLYSNRKEWGRNGINKRVLDELRRERLYPLKGPFLTKKHQRLHYFLNVPVIYYPLWKKRV